MTDEMVKELIKGRKQYRLADFNEGVIRKIWNGGRGRIDFLRATDKGELIVNAYVWNKHDARLAVAVMQAVKTPLKVLVVEYGYPYYYNHCFGAHNPSASDEMRRKVLADIEAARQAA